jgi:hypothetical protein
MPLQTRLNSLISAIGADIKALQTALVSVAKTGVNDAGLARGSFMVSSQEPTILISTSVTVIPLANVAFDPSGGANGIGYTVPVDGIYRVSGTWTSGGNFPVDNYVIINIQVSGVVKLSLNRYSSGPEESFSVDGLIKCIVGDTIQLSVRQDTGSDKITQTGFKYTYLCGELVGRTT